MNQGEMMVVDNNYSAGIASITVAVLYLTLCLQKKL